ncbi:helix-turn-helix transcriptional regulator [Legionella hackeliae]|uniref:Helix-turn-helix type 11 domain protein n=1 Tax=Legionella hackeliae TaxID=449 RepID=A0A0A8UW69_LEGHA|nr:YafY family protein [Legionella hackeliae]KTD09674.1 transcriptional regulator [Legionella hackeliae]CEK11009.1 Helix-turn-helix type 11 domain protein [Legionella hackeliae]STX47748.1 transcriptional regulator [Legionella hackeliae]
MSRSERLFELIQLLRRHRYSVSGAKLAEELGISLRTLYRDIASLQAQGAHIEGEPGVGYLLRPGFMLPPLMFSEEEIEALVLGVRWVSKRADSKLGLAAQNALSKITAVLPNDLRHQVEMTTLLIGPSTLISTGDKDLALIRQAVRCEYKLQITYTDAEDNETERLIWPFALGFFESVRIIIAWCELRGEFRHFRVDRIQKLTRSSERYPEQKQQLFKKWQEKEGITVEQ